MSSETVGKDKNPSIQIVPVGVFVSGADQSDIGQCSNSHSFYFFPFYHHSMSHRGHREVRTFLFGQKSYIYELAMKRIVVCLLSFLLLCPPAYPDNPQTATTQEPKDFNSGLKVALAT